MRILIGMLFLLGVSFTVSAQKIGEETRNGKLYTIHIVEAGNTLYGLHSIYNVPIEEIIAANPNVTEGLQIGQKLYIPAGEPKFDKEKQTFITHKVKRKETLYGISRHYDCTVQDILDMNPELESEGLKTGGEIKIPVFKEREETAPEVKPENPFISTHKDTVDSTVVGEKKPDFKIEFTDSIIDYEVQKGETLYSISRRFMVPVETLVEDNNIVGNSIKPGQILRIKLKREDIKEATQKEIDSIRNEADFVIRPDFIEEKANYKVLIALPLKLTKNAKILSGMYDESTKLDGLTDLSVSFLMGAQMAIDSLEKLGLNAKVDFLDTEGDLTKFKEYLGATNARSYDLVIGPFYESLVAHAAKWGKENSVPVVAVTKIATKLLEGNPYLLSTVPSDLTLLGGMAKYMAKNHADDNIIMIEGETEEVKKRVAYFLEVYNRSLPEGKGRTITMSSIGGTGGGTIGQKINAKGENFVVCLSDDIQHVMRFVNALNATKNSMHRRSSVTMIGLKDWNNIQTVNSYYKNRFNFQFASANHLDYDDEDVADFTTAYRAKYGSDPSKYAVHGFDVVLSQIAYLILGYDRNDGLMDHFNLKSIGPHHGSENSSVFISRQNDFEIELLDIISK